MVETQSPYRIQILQATSKRYDEIRMYAVERTTNRPTNMIRIENDLQMMALASRPQYLYEEGRALWEVCYERDRVIHSLMDARSRDVVSKWCVTRAMNLIFHLNRALDSETF